MKRNARKVELPTNFAEKLLDYQIEYKLSDRPSKETVKNLIEMYTIGVEYYESIRSHKYLYFQLKMNDIFMSAATIEAISQKNTPEEIDSPIKKKMRSSKEEDKIQAIQIKQKQQKMFNEVVENTSEKATVPTVKKMINDSDMRRIQHEEKRKKQIETQDQKLKEKLEKRKSRIMLSKSFSSAGIMGENSTSDTLFTEVLDGRQSSTIVKPLQVNFQSIIKQNQSDQDEIDEMKRRKASFNHDPSKKAKSDLALPKE